MTMALAFGNLKVNSIDFASTIGKLDRVPGNIAIGIGLSMSFADAGAWTKGCMLDMSGTKMSPIYRLFCS
ncbi:MAG: hypothetical protein EBY07_14825, partial [Actinobacteria bacterium]|nr:hypothetical protein [Actinomycetota bacterium]